MTAFEGLPVMRCHHCDEDRPHRQTGHWFSCLACQSLRRKP